MFFSLCRRMAHTEEPPNVTPHQGHGQPPEHPDSAANSKVTLCPPHQGSPQLLLYALEGKRGWGKKRPVVMFQWRGKALIHDGRKRQTRVGCWVSCLNLVNLQRLPDTLATSEAMPWS